MPVNYCNNDIVFHWLEIKARQYYSESLPLPICCLYIARLRVQIGMATLLLATALTRLTVPPGRGEVCNILDDPYSALNPS